MQTVEEKKDYHCAYYAKNKDNISAKKRAYRAAHPGENTARNRKKRTGFSRELFLATLAIQYNRCAICRIEFSTLPRLHIHADHCHTTKTPRGILCTRCNHGLGQFSDDPARLRRAADYLEHPPLEARP